MTCGLAEEEGLCLLDRLGIGIWWVRSLEVCFSGVRRCRLQTVEREHFCFVFDLQFHTVHVIGLLERCVVLGCAGWLLVRVAWTWT